MELEVPPCLTSGAHSEQPAPGVLWRAFGDEVESPTEQARLTVIHETDQLNIGLLPILA